MASDLATRSDQENAITWESSHGEMSITLAECRDFFCKTATDQELMLFLKLCQYQHLNPFLKEAYLVKYGDTGASIIVGKEVYTKRAMTIPDCEGFEAGIVVARPQAEGDPVMTHIEGAMKLPADILIGGYCKVRSASRGESYHAVALEEYIGTTSSGTPTKFWTKMPATMIRKVALVQALREMYPESFQGLYDASEMDAVPQTVEGSARVVNEDRGTRIAGAGAPGGMVTSDGPDLGDCPVHKQPWVVSSDKFKKDYWTGWHGVDGEGSCRLKDVYLTLTQEAYAVKSGLEYSQKEFNHWLKSRMGGTWSTLSDERKLEAYARCRADESTGEVVDAERGQHAMDDADVEDGSAHYDREVEADRQAEAETQQARATVTDPEMVARFAMSDEEKAQAEGSSETVEAMHEEAEDLDIPF